MGSEQALTSQQSRYTDATQAQQQESEMFKHLNIKTRNCIFDVRIPASHQHKHFVLHVKLKILLYSVNKLGCMMQWAVQIYLELEQKTWPATI